MRPAFACRAVLFDLDGTLIDTLPDIAAAVDHALLDLSLAPAGLERAATWVGNGAAKLLQRALRHQGADTEENHKRALELFLRHYAEQFTARSRLYEGVDATLGALATRGLKLAVCTNKPDEFVAPLLRHFRIEHHFALSVGAEETRPKKPHPAPLLYIAEAFGLTPGDCLMVGDSVNDVEAARAAAMPVIGVSYGYNHGVPIADCRPDAVVERFAQIAELIAAP